MRAQSLIISLIVGAILGVLASMVVKGNRYGAIGDVITGTLSVPSSAGYCCRKSGSKSAWGSTPSLSTPWSDP